MSENSKIKSDHIVLVLDQDADFVLNIMMSAAHSNPLFLQSIKHHGKLEALESFIKDISQKSHEAGWCDDPNCKYHEEKK